jgi:hypothetical protein
VENSGAGRKARGCSRLLVRQDAGLLRRVQFVENTTPAGLARDERSNKVYEIEKRDEDGEHNVDPGLAHDLRSRSGQHFGDAAEPQTAANGGEEDRKEGQSFEMKGRVGLEKIPENETDAQNQSYAIQKMSGESGLPDFFCVDTGDENLAVGEFEKTFEIGLDVGQGEALGKKQDGAAGAFKSAGHGIVIADGIFPFVDDANLVEDAAADGGAATPAKITAFLAEHSDDGSIPGSQESGGRIAAIGDKPAHSGGGADARIGERSDEVMQPGLSGATIGIGKDEHFEFGRQLLDRYSEVVHFFAATFGLSRDNHVGFRPGLRGDALHNAVSRIGFRRQDKEDFVILIIHLGE